MKIQGLKCDSAKCSYVNPHVKREDFPLYLGKPCPQCGTPLLTKSSLRMLEILESLELVLPEGLKLKASFESETVLRLEFLS